MCKNPFDGLEILANGDVYGNAPTGVVFVNANTQNPTPIGNFDITISGANADKVINDVGKKEFKVVGGMLSLALQEGVKPTETNPIQFHISAEPTGYAPISQTITLTHDSMSFHMIRMVQFSNLPEGTAAIAGNTTTLAGNTTTQEKKFSLASTPTKPESTSIALQTGTQFQSEAGTPLTGGAVTTNIVQYSTLNSTAAQAIPGGLSSSNVFDQNGTKLAAGSFTPAGVVSIDMKVGNQDVKKFSKPLKVDMEINNQLINPTTGQAIKAGDQIPVWSLDEAKGEYKRESTSTVVSNNGKLMASFDVNHLSVWMMAYWDMSCSLISSVNISVANYNDNILRVNPVIVNRNNQVIHTVPTTVVFKNGGGFFFLARTANIEVKAVFYSLSGEKIGETNYFNPCNQRDINITLDTSTLNDVNVDLDLEGKCPGKQTTIYPNALLKISEVKSNGSLGTPMTAYVKNGKGNLVLKDNTKYKLEVVYDGTIKTSEFTFNKSGMSLPSNNGLTGTVSYDASTKTTKLKAQFSIPNCK